MKIAMLSAHSCPVGNLGTKDTGGMSVYIRELAGELGRQGHNVDIYTRVHDPADPIIIDLGERARLIHLKAGREDDIHKLALYCYLPEFTCNLENFRKDNGPSYDIVFSHYWLSGWSGAYLQRWWQVPHVAMFHTLGAVKNTIGIGEEEPELRTVTERETIAGCDRIIATTEREKGELIGHYGAQPEKIGIVPCGVNTEQFQPVDKHEARRRLGIFGEKVLLFVGRIDPLKGIDRLLSAVPLLRDRSGVRLVVIGGDEPRQSDTDAIRKLASELDIIDMVDFHGTVKHSELYAYYSAADVCVVPSYHESFGLVALESLACGTPVVGTDTGALKAIIRQGKTGYVAEDNSPGTLARYIDLALSGHNGGIAPAASIRESIADYTWSKIAPAIATELSTALDNRVSLVA